MQNRINFSDVVLLILRFVCWFKAAVVDHASEKEYKQQR